MARRYRFEHLEKEGLMMGRNGFPTQSRPVTYLAGERRLFREQYRLTIRNGRLYDAQGHLFDTTRVTTAHGTPESSIFVMDRFGNIYSSTFQSVGQFHHSSFNMALPGH